MPALETTILGKVADAILVGLSMGALWVIRKLAKHDKDIADLATAVKLTNQHDERELGRRKEESESLAAQRTEMLDLINSNHKEEMKISRDTNSKIDKLIINLANGS